MVEPKDRQTILLSEVEEDVDIAVACYIEYVESQSVIELLNKNTAYEYDSSNRTVSKSRRNS